MDAVDAYIPVPERAMDKDFLMPIEDVFSISGRGTVVTGRVERGIVKVGEEVEIVGIRPTQKKVVTGVEMFRKLLDQGQAGDNVGLLLRGTERKDVERGQVCAKPGSITPHMKFTAQAYILTKEEGGRHTPFFNGYRPQFFFRTTDVTSASPRGRGSSPSKHVFRRELHHSWIKRVENLAELRRIQVRSDCSGTETVQHIKTLESNLDRLGFP